MGKARHFHCRIKSFVVTMVIMLKSYALMTVGWLRQIDVYTQSYFTLFTAQNKISSKCNACLFIGDNYNFPGFLGVALAEILGQKYQIHSVS